MIHDVWYDDMICDMWYCYVMFLLSIVDANIVYLFALWSRYSDRIGLGAVHDPSQWLSFLFFHSIFTNEGIRHFSVWSSMGWGSIQATTYIAQFARPLPAGHFRWDPTCHRQVQAQPGVSVASGQGARNRSILGQNLSVGPVNGRADHGLATCLLQKYVHDMIWFEIWFDSDDMIAWMFPWLDYIIFPIHPNRNWQSRIIFTDVTDNW